MLSKSSLNSLIKISVYCPSLNKTWSTELITRKHAIETVINWLSCIIEYRDEYITDAVFTVISIELPKGAGRHRQPALVDPLNDRCVSRVLNTLCLVKSVITLLSIE